MTSGAYSITDDIDSKEEGCLIYNTRSNSTQLNTKARSECHGKLTSLRKIRATHSNRVLTSCAALKKQGC